MFISIWGYNIIIVFGIGCLFGITEIFSRYTESKYLSKVWQFYAYILLNGLVSILALFLIKYFRGVDPSAVEKIEINNLIIAGLGGMIILRSSIFPIKHKGEKVEIGFGSMAQIFLDKVESKMNANSASLRMKEINKLMKNIDFNKAKYELTTLCISYIDKFPPEDTTSVMTGIEKIANLEIDNLNKSLQLGRILSRYCDYTVLKTAIEILDDKIKVPAIDSNLPLGDELLDDWIDKLK